jgi:hypothetical protein
VPRQIGVDREGQLDLSPAHLVRGPRNRIREVLFDPAPHEVVGHAHFQETVRKSEARRILDPDSVLAGADPIGNQAFKSADSILSAGCHLWLLSAVPIKLPLFQKVRHRIEIRRG